MLVTDLVILNSSPVIEVKYGVASGVNDVNGTCGVASCATETAWIASAGRFAAVLRIRNTPVSNSASRSKLMWAESTVV